MQPPTKRKLYLGVAILSGCGLPLTALTLLFLLNPFALVLSASFSITNQLNETVFVTPLGGVRMASGAHRWRVLPQLAVPFLAAPALRQTHVAVPPDRAVSIRANFDDISLAVIAVRTSDGEEWALLVDANAAKGGCCYAPKQDTVVISTQDLMAADERMIDVVTEAERQVGSRLRKWYAWVGIGLLPGFLFCFSLIRYRGLGPETPRERK